MPVPTCTCPTLPAGQRLQPDCGVALEFGTHSSSGSASATYVHAAAAGGDGGSSFDVQQRFQIVRGLALEVRRRRRRRRWCAGRLCVCGGGVTEGSGGSCTSLPCRFEVLHCICAALRAACRVLLLQVCGNVRLPTPSARYSPGSAAGQQLVLGEGALHVHVAQVNAVVHV